MDESDYRLHRDDMYRLVYARVRDHAVAEDVVQESFLRVLRYPRGGIANVGALVRTIASNLIRDHARTRRRHAEEPLSETFDIASDAPSAETALIDQERAALVARIVDEMPPLRREVFVRRRLHGESARAVATALGLTPAAVDAHVARAVLALHNAMTEIGKVEDAA